MSIVLTKYGLHELAEELANAPACQVHGADDNMTICPSCAKIRCRKCTDELCETSCDLKDGISEALQNIKDLTNKACYGTGSAMELLELMRQIYNLADDAKSS